MKLSVSLVIFALLQHGLSAPTGRHPGQNPHSASPAGGPPPNEQVPSTGNASGQQSLPPLHKVLRSQNSPNTNPGPSSSHQHHGLLPPFNELVGHPIRTSHPPVRRRNRWRSRQKPHNVGRYKCTAAGCGDCEFDSPNDYGRHITDAHSIPINKELAHCKTVTCVDTLVNRTRLTYHMKTKHNIHIVDLHPHLPTPGSFHRSRKIPNTHPVPSSSHQAHEPSPNSGTTGADHSQTSTHSNDHLNHPRVYTPVPDPSHQAHGPLPNSGTSGAAELIHPQTSSHFDKHLHIFQVHPGSFHQDTPATTNAPYTCNHASCANPQIHNTKEYKKHLKDVHSTPAHDNFVQCNHCEKKPSNAAYYLKDHMKQHGIFMVDA